MNISATQLATHRSMFSASCDSLPGPPLPVPSTRFRRIPGDFDLQFAKGQRKCQVFESHSSLQTGEKPRVKHPKDGESTYGLVANG